MPANPFRKDPNIDLSIPEKIKEWGKVKFKPTVTKKPMKQGFSKERICDKYSAKFNVVARNARPEQATPWKKFKDEMLVKEREEEQQAKQDYKGVEAETFLKQREINYRKSLILEKINEPTKWEDFQDENSEKDHQQKQLKKKLNSTPSQTGSKGIKVSKNIISPEMLNNFDSKNLTTEQNDKLRRLITKTTIAFKGATLKQAVKNLKRNQKSNR